MVMPRPRGKPLKIAEKTIPGLKAALQGSRFIDSYGHDKRDVEQRVIATNENLGKEFKRITR